ncbi:MULTISPECIES: FxLD family lanthipeptide [unclassified Micromonospora]|uniref:FxLD family lanthipeptide n=1 Tax=unclassified Micromonospora TaxID=2617518 RepID=UPI001C24EDDC|nr:MULTISPECIES: FxLD family lanthipeptide [unclassified Micromonospora]MBU8857679.1 FxLD family lanthipeptide [Micromonospora sp. WMMB482]MDM4783306.1 FxLD family lanthipeptide [Micromonospora sp. b486]
MLTSPAPLDLTEGSGNGSGGNQAAAFALDVTVVEQGDLGGLVQLTDDGCGSTCTACTTG